MPLSDVAGLVAEAAADQPDRLAVVEAGGRGVTWAELDHEVDLVASGLGAQASPVPVNPGSTAAELARMIADSGARMVVADPDTVTAVREAVGSAGDDAGPRIVVIAATLRPGERSYDHLRAGVVRPVP